LGIGELVLYAAETNVFTMIVMVIWNILKLNKFKKGIELGAKLIMWGLKIFSRPPFGLTLKMEASGEINRGSRQLEIYLHCPDVYKSTAIAAVACILQLLDGIIEKKGVAFMGHALNIERYMKDLSGLGMIVKSKWK
jgi:hypothetical protein